MKNSADDSLGKLLIDSVKRELSRTLAKRGLESQGTRQPGQFNQGFGEENPRILFGRCQE